MSKSEAEETLAFQIDALGLPKPERQHKFMATRKFTADFAWPTDMLMVEVEGFGHHKLNRYFGDIEKYNYAEMLGWTLLRFTPKQVDSGVALSAIEWMLRPANRADIPGQYAETMWAEWEAEEAGDE